MTWGDFFILTVIVFGSGLAGGFFNALRTDNGNLGSITVPLGGAGQQPPPAGQQPPPAGWRPGLALNSVTGGLAALLSWALYGPLAALNVLDLSAATEGFAMTLSAIGGAFFVGFGGARWLSAEADKRILQTSNSVMGDVAGTAVNNAAGVSNNAAEVATRAAEVATAAATAAKDPQLAADAQQVADQATEIRDQAQDIQVQSQQLKGIAEEVKVAETPAKVLNIAQRSAQAVG
jgi:hypothetical protein